MKKISYFIIFILLASCTSNTIFEKPKDLIPKDTMSLLIQELTIASSSMFVKNKNIESKINYMPLVYKKFKIDSLRFQTSNLYYMSKIDVYQEILTDAKESLGARKAYFSNIKKERDSIRKDSIEKSKISKKLKAQKDSLQNEALEIIEQ